MSSISPTPPDRRPVNTDLHEINQILGNYKNTPENNRKIQRLCENTIKNVSASPSEGIDINRITLFKSCLSTLKTKGVFHRIFTTSKTETALTKLQGTLQNFETRRSNVLNAVKSGELRIQNVAEEFQNDREIVLAAVTQCGYQLCHVPEKFRDDPAIVLAAVTQGDEALEFASQRLRDDPDIVLAAVGHYRHGLSYASERLKDDPAIVLRAASHDLNALLLASKRLQNDQALIIVTLQSHLSKEELTQTDINCFGLEAAKNGHIEVLQFLLSEGRTLSPYNLGITLEYAARKGNLNVLNVLLPQGRSIYQSDLGTAVSVAAANGHLEVIRFLLSDGRALSIEQRESLILSMSIAGNIGVLELLLQQGAIHRAAIDSSYSNAGRHLPPGEEQVILIGRIRDMLRSAPLLPEDTQGTNRAPAREEDALYTTFAEVKENPTRYLELVTTQFPRRVVLLDSPGTIDLGGVTKEFISTLMKSLLEKTAFPITETGFPKQIPRINPETSKPEVNEESRAIYQRLGKFYSLLDQKNTDRTDKFVTGTVFHPGFFQIVKKVGAGATPADLRKEAAQQIIAAESEKPSWAAVILDPENRVELEAYAAALGCTPAEAQEYLASTEALIDQVVAAARSFYEGVTPAFRIKIQCTDPLVLAHMVQGEPISKVSLLAALSRRPELSEERYSWVLDKIETSDEAWRKKFVKAITGNEVLSPGMKISIGACWRGGGRFEIHTCFNSLDIPTDVENADLLAALDSVLDEGYNTA
ncbi:MAG: DUF4116 domain-containing protein [Chlamydiae bacterium]|nr:DUF4116 domain-containing protein [Chlamydiota bacterium]